MALPNERLQRELDTQESKPHKRIKTNKTCNSFWEVIVESTDLARTVYDEVVSVQSVDLFGEPVTVLLQVLHAVDERTVRTQTEVSHSVVDSDQFRDVHRSRVARQLVGRVYSERSTDQEGMWDNVRCTLKPCLCGTRSFGTTSYASGSKWLNGEMFPLTSPNL